MNENAQNALLKTFEEPSPGTTIILTTDNYKRLRETILSRCWQLKLTPTTDTAIQTWLEPHFPNATGDQFREALRAAEGRPGGAWRQLETAMEQEEGQGTRFRATMDLLARLDRAVPVGALGFTEEALKLSKQWWKEDAGDEGELKNAAAKANRAAVARFLDELMAAGRARWVNDPGAEDAAAARLDLIRKTRHYILRNANTNLALDVLFCRLIALRPRPGSLSKSVAGRART
jgi:DNA polymerase III delta prime subunit